MTLFRKPNPEFASEKRRVSILAFVADILWNFDLFGSSIVFLKDNSFRHKP
jgi:hypothetical protein